MLTFFNEVTSGLQTINSWSVRSSAASIGPSKSGPVPMTTALRPCDGVENGGEVRLTHHLRLFRTLGEQQGEPGSRVHADESFQLVDADVAARRSEIGDRCTWGNGERQSGVPDLQIEVD